MNMMKPTPTILSVLLLLSAVILPGRAAEFDLSGLPTYVPQHRVEGVLRFHGNAYGGLIGKWQEAFQRHHPRAQFQNTLPSSDTAFPALVTGVADLAPNGSEPALVEWLSFYEVFGYHATDIIVGTGTYDTPGRSPGMVIFVHKDNPLTRLTVDQLDGIFGAERNGSMVGFKWTLENARGPEQNIRTWGQLGLTGEWADKPINTYGHAPTGAARFFQLHVLKNSDKWNPNFQGFVETGTKMISDTDREQRGGVQHMLRDLLANDRYGIAWTIMPQAQGIPGIKLVALAPRGGGNYVLPSRATFQNRSYPLTRNIYLYLNRKPGTPLEPRIREFLRFVLSREGQEIVMQEGGFLPLTAELAAAQRARLD
jgi:phosphate transport system substrate-binding protein